MNFKRTFLFIFLLTASRVCLAQGPLASSNTSASSRINVRIPAFAIITLADNNSKNISYNSAKDSKKLELSQTKATGKVVSNGKWSVNVFREESATGTFASSTNLYKSNDVTTKTASVTVVYVTSMN